MDNSAQVELTMVRAQMAIAAGRITELEAEKEGFDEQRMALEDTIKGLRAELDESRSNEQKAALGYEELIQELETKLSAEQQKRLNEFNLFENKKAEISVRTGTPAEACRRLAP